MLVLRVTTVHWLQLVDMWTLFSGREQTAAIGIIEHASMLRLVDTWSCSSGRETKVAPGDGALTARCFTRETWIR